MIVHSILNKNACDGRELRFSERRKRQTKASHRHRRFLFQNTMQLQPSYYTVLPSRVRYCDKITAEAKLVYAELNAIAQSRVLVVSVYDLYSHFEKYMDLPSHEVHNCLLELHNNNFLFFDASIDNKFAISIK